MLLFPYIVIKKVVILRKDKESRKNLILDTLNQEKKIKTGDLLKLLDVSPITLRKDLKELELLLVRRGAPLAQCRASPERGCELVRVTVTRSNRHRAGL